jgi:rubrerythrin
VGLWDRIRDALSAIWADWRDARRDERTRLVSELTAAWLAEQRVSTQLRQIIPAIPYEQLRRRLERIAQADEQHAAAVLERLKTLGGPLADPPEAHAGSENRSLSGPWHRLQQVLRQKRELYERYRQAASVVDEAGLQALLGELRDDEERHQEALIETLIHLDAHVHETIT